MNLLSVALGLLPGFVWLLFYLQEDLHPEPKGLLLKTFLAGMAGAFFTLAIQILLNAMLGILQFRQFVFISFLLLAFVEEISKFLAAYLSIHKNKEFDEPVDAMIYMVVAALGFATVENLGAISSSGQTTTLALLSSIFTVTVLRFVGATLLHTLSSAIVGYYWARGIRNFMSKKYIFWGLAIATLLHGTFNYLILNFGNVVYSVIFITVIGFYVLADFEELKNKNI